MSNNQPKAQARTQPEPNEKPTKAEPVALGHPVFGTAPVAVVTVARLRYRNGDAKTAPYRTPLQPIPPERLVDLGAVGTIYGPGRYDLRAVDERGVLAWQAIIIDCPDEEGNLHLIAPMPPVEAVAGGLAAAPGPPQIQKDLVDIYKDIAAQAEKSRANDFQAFVKLMEAQRSAPSSGGELVSFLHAELQASRSRCSDLERRLDESREEGQKSRDNLLRKTLSSDSKDDLFSKALQVAVDRFGGGVLPGASGASGSGGAAADEIRLPSAEELAGMLHQGVVPQNVIVQAVKLYRAGGLRPDLWALVEPVAAMAGLL